jgi:hypothetical protein
MLKLPPKKYAEGGPVTPAQEPEAPEWLSFLQNITGMSNAGPAMVQSAKAGIAPMSPTGVPGAETENSQQIRAELADPNMDPRAALQGQPSAAPQPEQYSQVNLGAQDQGAPSPMTASLGPMEKALNMQEQGIRMQARAEADAAQEQARIQARHQEQMDAVLKNIQQAHAEIEPEINAAVADIRAGHIDPKAYMNSKSDLGKVSTAIGLILGGMGAGLTGGENAALKFLQHNIEQDMRAQMANLDNKKTLLGALEHKLGNRMAAISATKAILLENTASKLQEAAAKAGTPLAMARAQQAMAPLMMERAQLAQRAAVLTGMTGAAKSGALDPANAVPILVPKEHQESVYKEIQAAQNTKHMAASIMKSFDEAVKENTILKTVAGMVRTPGSVYALRQHMMPTFVDLEGSATESKIHSTFENITPKPGDSDHTIQQKREMLQEYLRSKQSAPRAKSFGIDLQRNPSTAQTTFTPRH